MGLFASFPVRTIFFLILCHYWLPFIVKCFNNDRQHYLYLYLDFITISNSWRVRHGLTFLYGSLDPENLLPYRHQIPRIWAYMIFISLVMFKFGRFCWMRCLAKAVLAISGILLCLQETSELWKGFVVTGEYDTVNKTAAFPLALSGLAMLI